MQSADTQNVSLSWAYILESMGSICICYNSNVIYPAGVLMERKCLDTVER